MPPIQHLTNPEYLHTLINPMPVYGLSMGVVAMIVALIARRRAVTVAALIVIFLSALSAWPTFAAGQAAYDRVLAMSDPQGSLWLDEHMARAERLIYIFYALAALALAGLLVPLKWPRTSMPLAIATLVLAFVTLGVGGFIAYAGGHVRHKEFRYEEAPMKKEAEHHHHGGAEHDEAAEGEHDDAGAPAHPHGPAGGMEHGQPMSSPSPAGTEQSPMAHDMPMPTSPAPAPQTPEQLEAARMQLEASRMQLDASRKQLEATQAGNAPGAPMSPSPARAQPTATEGEHKHDHH